MDDDTPPQCFIVADANSEIGTGHVIRCCVLGGHLQKRGVDISFLLADTAEEIQEHIERSGFGLHILQPEVRDDPSQLLKFLHSQGVGRQFLLYDSDHKPFYQPSYQKRLREAGIGLMMISFHNPNAFYVHFLHNQNPLSLDTCYHTPWPTKKFLGLDYLILKEPYKDFHNKSTTKIVANPSTILLTFGGADHWDLTRKIVILLGRLNLMKSLRIHIVVGPLYPNLTSLKAIMANSNLDLHLYVNTNRMPQLMFESDLAISSGGLTVWELACCKTINFVIPTSSREIDTARKLASDKLIHFADSAKNLTEENILHKVDDILCSDYENQDMVDRFHRIVNPDGAKLVVSEICSWLQEKKITNRSHNPNDI